MTAPFFRINKLAVEWVRSRDRAQKATKYLPTHGIPAFGLRLFDEQVEQIEQGLFVRQQLVDGCDSVEVLPPSTSRPYRVTSIAETGPENRKVYETLYQRLHRSSSERRTPMQRGVRKKSGMA